jgi:hypothetical protein
MNNNTGGGIAAAAVFFVVLAMLGGCHGTSVTVTCDSTSHGTTYSTHCTRQ